MKKFFLHPTVKKVCYIVGLLTIAGWLLGLVGKGIYHTAYNNGLISEEHKYHEWHDRHDDKKWQRKYRRIENMCEDFLEEDLIDQEARTEKEVTQ